MQMKTYQLKVAEKILEEQGIPKGQNPTSVPWGKSGNGKKYKNAMKKNKG